MTVILLHKQAGGRQIDRCRDRHGRKYRVKEDYMDEYNLDESISADRHRTI